MNDDEFEWDAAKAESNLKKHGVGFEAARLVFDDVFALDRLDTTMGYEEERFVITGLVNAVLLTVVYTERSERTRIISARIATANEEREYHHSPTQG
ncbi:MAG: BrnT family toxin [Proteobacteria bacterium]|nr:BrnT family toxin [Pseudomonadota bacterium]